MFWQTFWKYMINLEGLSWAQVREHIWCSYRGTVGEALEAQGLHQGRMISASKSYYYKQHPDHDVFFNACIFIKGRRWLKVTYRQIWQGDIDITLSRAALIAIADAAGVDLYVTCEKYRWKGYQGQRGENVFVFKHGGRGR